MLNAPFDLTCSLAGAAGLVTSLELVASKRAFGPGGVLDLRAMETSSRIVRLLGGLGLAVPELSVLTALSWLRAAASVVLVLPGSPSALRAAASATYVLAALATDRYLAGRTEWGEHLLRVVLLAVGGGAFVGTEAAARSAMAFVALYVALLYVTTGIRKALTPEWRSGHALWATLSLESTGCRRWGARLRRWPALSRGLSIALIAWQMAFPMALVMPGSWRTGYLMLGVVFHLSASATLGLNTYAMAFLATYPSVWATATTVREWLQGP